MSGIGGDALELGRDLMVAPVEAARVVLSEPRDGALALLLFGGVTAQALSAAIADGQLAMGGLAVVSGALLSALLMIVLGGALVHLFADLLGGEGSAGNLLRVCAMTYYPNLLLPPFALAGDTMFGLARAVVLVWQLALLVIGLREAYRVSSAVAVATLVIPVVLIMFFLPMATLFVLLMGLVSAS